jgi:tRNA (guanine37-N1)-methyltransferase
MGLRAQLAGVLPDRVLPLLSDHFEVIGDVAVLTLPGDLRPYGRTIAEAIVARRRNIYTVLNKTSSLTGPHRTGTYETLYGGTTVTVYHEFGFSYRLDVARSFFSARLAYERRRVTEQVEPGEQVYVPFAGVGPFAIPAAARGADVVAVEKNPDAFAFLLENVLANHTGGSCHVLQGDALDTTLLPHQRFDRLIIPAPYGMDHALDLLLPLLKRDGMAHLYTFTGKEQVPALIGEYEERGLGITFYSDCGNVAPGISRRVFDLVCP